MHKKTYRYPRQNIQRVVASVFDKAYGQVWDPRVVRQTKQLKLGSLEHIDYAVPCFEMSQVLKQSPAAISEKLAHEITANNIGNFKVEAVGGYLNFQISNHYLAEALTVAEAWFKEPWGLSGQKQSTDFLIVGPTLGIESTLPTLSRVAHGYIHDVYDTLEQEAPLVQLVGDSSAEVVDGLVKLLSQEATPASLRQLRRSSLLTNQNAQKELKQLKDSFLEDSENTMFKDGTLVMESELDQEAQDFFATVAPLAEGVNAGVVKDDDSGAAYYLQEDKAWSLRSSSGLLYKLAYVLYMIKKLTTASQADAQSSLIVMASQRLHPVIYSFAFTNLGPEASSRIVCFDPAVSHADITEITQHNMDTSELLDMIFKNLADLPKNDGFKFPEVERMAILGLIDFLIELNSYVMNNQIPAIFDALNQSFILAKLLSPEFDVSRG
jgi:hypothetical protein